MVAVAGLLANCPSYGWRQIFLLEFSCFLVPEMSTNYMAILNPKESSFYIAFSGNIAVS